MNLKLTFVLCLAIYVNKATPPLSETLEQSLEKLGLGYKDIYDYNTYILGIETVIENAQKAAIDTIQQIVDVTQEFTRIVKSLGVHENIKEINKIQTDYFQLIEDMRHQAFNQEVDISSCAFTAVHLLNTESDKSISNTTGVLTDITNTFSNYSQHTYAEPTNENLKKTYTVRERIYKCPFSFTDFNPFLACLTTTAVLQDIVLLNQFTASLNDTTKDILTVVYQYSQAAELFRIENVNIYNATANSVYNDVLIPCAREKGLYINK